MKLKIDLENQTLTISADDSERRDLAKLQAEYPDVFDSDSFTYEMLENLFTNDCFMMLPEGLTSDLTSAPMLGILGNEETHDKPIGDCQGMFACGSASYQPVLYRWAFMNYAITSPQRDLIEDGTAVWQGGEYLERDGQMGFVKSEIEFSAHTPSCCTT